MFIDDYIGERLKLEGETENMGVWTKKRGIMRAVVLMATPSPKSLWQRGELPRSDEADDEK